MSFSEKIINWYLVNKRVLPWRETKDPYFVWLSEIILQQTKVSQGLPYYNVFTREFPTVFHLASAEESTVLKFWQGLGYYSRARNLHASAKIVANDFKGVFPNSYKELIKLKGVGDYTASAIASFSFNESTAVVDGNVYRVLSRHFGIDTPINVTEGIKLFKVLAQDLIDKKRPAEFNQAIMEFGALHCKPKKPLCHDCPFSSSCIAFNTNKIEALPVKLKKIKVKKRFFNFLVMVSEDAQIVIEQRSSGIWQNLYQFPLIEVKSEFVIKEMEKELEDYEDLKGATFQLYQYNEKPIVHKLSHQHLYATFWVLKTDRLPVTGIPIATLNDYPVPVLIASFIKAFNFESI